MNIQCKRVYDPAEQSDGYRVLVDRLWPRGIKKTDLALDEWDKEITCAIAVSSGCTAIIPLSIRDNLTNDCIKKSNFSVCSKMVAISS